MNAGLLVTAASLLVAGCGAPVYDEKVDGPYRLFSADNPDAISLCRSFEGGGGCAGLVGPTVIAIGYNATYLVAARLPFEDRAPFDGQPDKPEQPIQYFYVVRAPQAAISDRVNGPLDEATYFAERDRLNLPRLMPIPH